MSDNTTIMDINSYEDINKITNDTRYINIPIDKVDMKIIDYFLLNGTNYLYSDILNNKNGFIYTDYQNYKIGESLIDGIVSNIPSNLSMLEKVRYLYISLGKLVGFDINVLSGKNEVISFSTLTYLNNIWGALSKRKVTELSLVKIFAYLCSKIGVKCEIINSNINGNLANKVYLDNSFIVVNLAKDIANVKAGFATEYFDKYNNDKQIDKKILYIKDDYVDNYLDKLLKNIDYTSDDILYQILMLTEKVFDIKNIDSYELLMIYKKIFNKYCSNYDIKINNFYINDRNMKEHFIIFNYGDDYYSYNYSRKCFIKLDYDYLINNLKSKKIGLYLNEDFNIIKERVVL